EFTVENRAVIVCGGGKICRTYQHSAEQVCKINDYDKDMIGIAATRLNAEMVRSLFGDKAFEKVITDPTQKINTDKKIIIGAGWKPGFSSDMDAVVLAEQFQAAEVLNISNIDYVYDKDPKKYKDAKKLEKISWQDYFKIIGTEWKPGMNSPFDPIASKKAKEASIKVKILNAEIENLKKCINGYEFSGTVLG
ncbi:MAG: UMP kinase, partial [Candidatus Woesearchaeota archaeon]